MKTPEEVKVEFEENLNHNKVSDLGLTENQKIQLNTELANFINNNNVLVENFISKKRTYIESNKYHTMTQYIEKILEENDINF